MNVKLELLRDEYLEKVMNWRMSPDITRYCYTDPQLTLDGQRKWHKRLQADDASVYWVVVYDGTPVGVVNLIDIDFCNSRCEWGYYIAEKKFRSFNFAIFLEWNVYDYVFDRLGLNRLYGCVFAENDGVIKLHTMCGSKLEGIQRQHIRKNGVYHDLAMVGILADEWAGKKRENEYDKFAFEDKAIIIAKAEDSAKSE